MSTTYVKFTDLSTGALLVGGGMDGWTPVDSDSFDQTLATGFAQAKPGMPPAFSLPLADSGVAVALQAAAAAGHLLQTEVASYDSSGRLTSDYLLTFSVVTGDDVTGAGGSLVQTVALEVGTYTSRITSYDPATGAGTTTAGGYNFVNKTPITTPAGTAPSDPSTLTASASTDATSYGKVNTFAVLTNSQGQLIGSSSGITFPTLSNDPYLPTSGKYLSSDNGAFIETPTIAYDLSDGTNRTTASFSYSALPNSTEPLLFDMTLNGTALDQVELIQTALSATGHNQVVTDTVLKNVTVTGVTFDLGDGGADGRIYQFQAGAGSYTTSHESTSAAPTTKSFTLSAPAAGAAGVAAPDGVAQRGIAYALTIQSYAGTSTNTAISSARFAVTGDGPGTGAFSPLTITFDTAPSASVLAALATPMNQTFTLAQEKASGVNQSPHSFDTLTLANVQLSGAPVITDNGDGTSSYTYTFSVGGVQDVFTQQNTDGSYTSVPTAGWNRTTNISTGQSEVTQTPACYCPGTLILTDRGDRPVEALSIGDRLVTAAGERRAIKWIGRRSYLRRFIAANLRLNPIRLQARCLGGGLPRRDLLVSPEHAMLIDGLLMPARCLVNGHTVRQERPADRLDYIHVELDSHDVILAEGAPSETFVDDDSRGMFHNAQEFEVLYPDVAPSSGGLYYARRVDSGPELEAVRRRMSDVAAAMALAA